MVRRFLMLAAALCGVLCAQDGEGAVRRAVVNAHELERAIADALAQVEELADRVMQVRLVLVNGDDDAEQARHGPSQAPGAGRERQPQTKKGASRPV